MLAQSKKYDLVLANSSRRQEIFIIYEDGKLF